MIYYIRRKKKRFQENDCFVCIVLIHVSVRPLRFISAPEGEQSSYRSHRPVQLPRGHVSIADQAFLNE